jgi:hypothetical protein
MRRALAECSLRAALALKNDPAAGIQEPTTR